MHPVYLAANEALQKLGTAGQYAQYQTGTTAELGLIGIITAVINIVLALVGVIFLILLIYAGYTYMTAGGDSDKVSKATATITRSVIGILIILFSYAIANFIVPRIVCMAGNTTACPNNSETLTP